ncbi:testis-expressed protein 47-like isoform X1 [Mytilus edulis]|uniref:testis-expressed protein 47-like isoform X1 n=1 Tax=Mytilus trossulus TaxID=6551 RepID=UPI00300584A9
MATSSTPQPEISGPESEIDDGEEKPKAKKKLRKKVQKKRKTPEFKFDWPKKNYFDVKYGEIDPVKNLLHRMVYIASLRNEEADTDQIANYHENLKKNLESAQQYSEHVSITGLLLVYTKHIVHIVETTTEMLREVIKDSKKNMEASNGLFSQVKILVISHDIPERLYQNWMFKTLEIQSARLDSYDSSESTDKIVLDCLIQLLKLGNHVAKIPKGNFKNSFDQLHSKCADLLPQQAMLHFLLEEDDCSMMTVKEYLNMYEQPYDVVLDSELVWPLPTRLFPYN